MPHATKKGQKYQVDNNPIRTVDYFYGPTGTHHDTYEAAALDNPGSTWIMCMSTVGKKCRSEEAELINQ